MTFEQWDRDRYYEYIEDVEIANKELANMKLLPKHNILCDLYAIPSHDFQAYYGIVYENNGGLELVYAKPEIYIGNFTKPIRMYPFKTVKEAECHSNASGHIIIGIKTLPSDLTSMIRDIIDNMPTEYILTENEIIIDGVFQAIRFYNDKKVVKQIVYRDADKIFLPKEKEYLKNVLDNLYLEIGNIIK